MRRVWCVWCVRCVVALMLAVCRAAGTGGAGLLPPETERLRAPVGGFVLMNCHLDFPFGHEIPYHLQWDKDGETIFSWYSGEGAPRVAPRWGGRVHRVSEGAGAGAALGRGSVNLTAVRETDAGLYRCRVSFPNRTPPARNNGTFYYLDVDGSNLILTPPTNATVLEGERAELECAPKSAAAEVQWFKDDLPLDALPELATRAQRPANGSLLLPAASSADAGRYACRVRAPDRPDLPAQTADAVLDVQYKAKVVYAPEERFLPFGKGASLDCHFSANPPLTNLRWEKDGFLFDPYNVPGVFYSRNGSLLFNQVDESHEGEYSCTPYNALGTAGPSPRVRVRVQRPPALAVRPLPLYAARLGQRLTLPCAPAQPPHHPPPDLAWTRKDGADLPAHTLEGGNLTLLAVGAADGGVYVCSARNAAAAVSAEAELRVENAPPRAPHSLVARSTNHSIHLSWQPGYSGVEAEYTVWYRGAGEAEWRSMRLLSRGVTEATLLALRPRTEYELRVLAEDHIGDGLFSRPLHVRTLDAEGKSVGETAQAAATTAPLEKGEAAEGWGGGEEDGDGEGGGLEVSVRLLDEGALVRWTRAPADGSRCAVRWLRTDGAGASGGEVAAGGGATMHTHHDYVLVNAVEEGGEYVARVRCASGAAGRATLRVPEYGRLRGVAAGAACAALLLAALAAALYLGRRRLCPRAPPSPAPARTPPYAPAAPPRADKRRF